MTDTTQPAQTTEPTDSIKPLGGLVRHLRIAVYAYIAVSVVYTIGAGLLLVFWTGAAGDLIADPVLYDQVATLTDLTNAFAGIAYLVALIWSAVIVCRWVFRAVKNLRIRGDEISQSPTMAVVWYFIPFASFWMPFAGMRQIWQHSLDAVSEDAGKLPASMGWWWFFWVAASILSNIATRLIGVFEPTYDTQQLVIGTSLDLISSLMFIASAILLMRFIPVISRAQDDYNVDGLKRIFS